MPRIFRSMKKDADGFPLVDQTNKGLGVCAGVVSGVVDIRVDESGNVVRDAKEGMSVAPNWRKLPPHLISRRLVDKVPKASGSPALCCFRMGEGPFEDGSLTDDLDFVRDKETHGVVVPSRTMSLDAYRADLAETRESWIVDES